MERIDKGGSSAACIQSKKPIKCDIDILLWRDILGKMSKRAFRFINVNVYISKFIHTNLRLIAFGYLGRAFLYLLHEVLRC